MEDFHDTLRTRALGHDLITTLPLDLLRAELQRRQETDKPSCGSKRNEGSYNVPIHVFALFLILIVSTLACSFPIIARRFPDLPIPHRFLFLSRHFGTGVLIATAFIHLLPTAFLSMTDPCLPRFWNEVYPPMPGLVAMISVFTVVTIEMIFASRGAGHTHDSEYNRVPPETQRASAVRGGNNQSDTDLALHKLHGTSLPDEERVNGRARQPLPRRSHDSGSDSDLEDLDHLDPVTDESEYLNRPGSHKTHHEHEHSNTDDLGAIGPDQNPQKLLLQCILLECGILFHSIFIGMAVSVATGASFVVLLVAIVFHQTFEGFALGARIAALIPALFPASSPKPWLMALAYGTTTPIGQALGLLLHRLYDPNSEVGLLVVGITNAISSGLLLFAGLVQLLSEDFLSDRSYEVLQGRTRIEACLAVAAGGLLMAAVGAFA